MSKKDGFLLINKEKGVTSHDVVFKIRKILNTKKTGHAGTLDPNAEGLLIVAVGKATRFIEYLEVLDKCYIAEILFGRSTDTDDITGEVIREQISMVSEIDLQRIIPNFTGKIMQVPPAYSAIKIQGQKACDMARKGKDFQLPERSVTIYELVLSDDSELPEKAILDIHCSKGTYIRSLCRDIGESIGIPACMGNLLRTRIGPFKLEEAITISALTEYAEEDQVPFISIDVALSNYRAIMLTERGEKMVQNGCLCYPWSSQTSFDDFHHGEIIRFIGSKGFLGVGSFVMTENDHDPDFVRPRKILGQNQ